ncbi:MAG TPA: hypothetical protein PLR30_04105 [Saprospiraceae bacterium]|nr:hypothetical protein [Saprospiraceae bacterium]
MKKADRSETHINLAIILLLQAVIYSGIWLWNEYVAVYLSLIFPGMILVILIIAGIADLIEPSRIPAWYYGLMIVSIITPLVIGAVFFYLYQGRLDWLV